MTVDHWIEGFQYNVEEWDDRDRFETLAICRDLDFALAIFKIVVTKKPEGRFTIRNRMRVVRKHPLGEW